MSHTFDNPSVEKLMKEHKKLFLHQVLRPLMHHMNHFFKEQKMSFTMSGPSRPGTASWSAWLKKVVPGFHFNKRIAYVNYCTWESPEKIITITVSMQDESFSSTVQKFLEENKSHIQKEIGCSDLQIVVKKY